MTAKEFGNGVAGLIFLAIVSTIGYAIWQGGNALEERKAAIAASTDPADIATLILGNDAQSRITWSGKTLDVEYQQPASWDGPSTATAFRHKAVELFPELFAKMSDVQSVRIVARSSLVDVRGNASDEVVARATITRANSASIQWSNVLPSNLPAFADDYWEHPALRK